MPRLIITSFIYTPINTNIYLVRGEAIEKCRFSSGGEQRGLLFIVPTALLSTLTC